MQVSQTQPLALENIARRWAAELRSTSPEEHPDGLLNRMRLAFVRGELSAADPAAARPLQKAAYELLTALAASGRYTEPTLGPLSYKINQVELSRAEFARWVQEQGYPPPTFWDGVAAATSRGAKLVTNSTSQSPITAEPLDLNRDYEEMAKLIDQVLGQLEDDPEATIREITAGLDSVNELLPAYLELAKKHSGDPHEIFGDIWDLDPDDLKGRTYKLMMKLIGQLLDQMEDHKSTDHEHNAALNLLSELLPMFWEAYPMGVPLKKHRRDADKNPPVPAATTTEPPRTGAYIVPFEMKSRGLAEPNQPSAVKMPATHPHSITKAGSQTLNLRHRKRGPKRSKKSMEATSRLEAALNSDPELLGRLPTLSEKDLAKICGCHHEKERHHIRTARDYVLKQHATK